MNVLAGSYRFRLMRFGGSPRLLVVVQVLVLGATGLGLLALQTEVVVLAGMSIGAVIGTLWMLAPVIGVPAPTPSDYRPELFRHACLQALSRSDIQNEVSRSRRAPQVLTERLAHASSEIWSVLARETEVLDDTLVQLNEAKSMSRPLTRRRRLLQAWGLILTVVAIDWFLTDFGVRLPTRLMLPASGPLVYGVVPLGLATALLIASWQQALLGRLPPRLEPELVALRTDDLNRKVERLRRDLLERLTDLAQRHMRPLLSALKEELDHREWALDLGIESAPGLSEKFDEAYVLSDTKMVRTLWQTMSALHGGGSVGIAGPRGCGKSILLRLLCRPGNVEAELLSERQRVSGGTWSWLPLLVSAPVSYEPREFLGHLFASLCREVIGIGNHEDLSQSRDAVPSSRDVRTRMLAALYLTFGLAIIAAGAIVIALPRLSPTSGNRISTDLSVLALGLAGSILGFSGFGIALMASRSPATIQRNATNLIAAELELRPMGMSLASGVAMSGIGWALVAAALSTAPSQPTNIAGAIIVCVGAIVPLYAFLSSQARSLMPWRVRDRRYPMRLVRESWVRLRELQFLQTINSSVSETLKLQNPFALPFSIEGGATRGLSLAQLPITYPELVAQFRAFCALAVSQRLQLVIGIDELDKIDSDETAAAFLNGIKAIFGQQGCYFVAAVSEDAIRNFESRGLPFRDVFDSCFDDVVAVHGFDFVEARRALNERVIGLPVAYVALCFCISGGFPRDLIRAARSITNEYSSGSTLGAVCRGVVTRWVRGRSQELLTRIDRKPIDGDLRKVLEACITLRQGAVNSQTLLRTSAELRDISLSSIARPNASECAESNVTGHLAAFCLYCGTLLQFFDDDLQRDRLETAIQATDDLDPRSLDNLALARRAFGLSAELAWEYVAAFWTSPVTADRFVNTERMYVPGLGRHGQRG